MNRVISAVTRLIALTLIVQGFGCAYLREGSSDKIHVQSLDPKARLYVDGQFIGTGTGTTTVRRDRTYTIAAKKPGCATTLQDTGSKFDETSLLGLVNDAPLLATLADQIGMVRSNGRTSPLTYYITPVCPSTAARAVS